MLFMFGGPSHLDTFDPKPLLARDSGKPLAPENQPRVLSFPNRMGNLVGSPFEFRQHGDSGAWVSSLFPKLASRADDLCIINSMHCSNSRHGGAVLEWHTGTDTFIRPSMGSWVTYGLGSENQNFPGYITICQDLSQGGANNFGSGFLPAVYQGTMLGHSGVRPQEAKIPFIGDGNARRNLQRLELDLIAQMEHHRAATRSGRRPRGADRVVRAGLPHAERVARDARRLERIEGNAQSLRPRRSGDRRLRDAVPSSHTVFRAWGAVRPVQRRRLGCPQ